MKRKSVSLAEFLSSDESERGNMQLDLIEFPSMENLESESKSLRKLHLGLGWELLLNFQRKLKQHVYREWNCNWDRHLDENDYEDWCTFLLEVYRSMDLPGFWILNDRTRREFERLVCHALDQFKNEDVPESCHEVEEQEVMEHDES